MEKNRIQFIRNNIENTIDKSSISLLSGVGTHLHSSTKYKT